MKMEIINISYSTSDSYAWLTGISLTSLFINNSTYKFNIHILDNGITEENKQKLKNICSNYCADINFYDLSIYKKNYKKFKIKEKWDFATFGRLFEAEILSNDIKKIIHLDCDTIINKDLIEMFNFDVNNVALAGVNECLSDGYRININVENERILFNAGVLIFNLEYIRNNKIIDRFFKCLNDYDKLEYLDQDVINMTLHNDEKKVLPLKFNAYSILFYFNYKQLLLIRRPYLFYSREEYNEAVNNPCIIHFTTCNYDYHRPWYLDNHHPYRYLFLEYYKKSLFNNKKLLKGKKSFKTVIARFLPKPLSCRISYIINQVFRPRLTKIKKVKEKYEKD